ncbi:PorT family protein [Flavobacteriaceae bacterium AH-315-B10]|nr:PorT family protein [Flavobacteriaceae bacterium AH-315-B10]
MRKAVFLILTLVSYQSIIGQTEITKETDALYREDQFYFGITYNLLSNMPKDMSQNGFSSGFHLGFIRDMPINKSRTLAFGLGLGYSANSYNQNLLISKNQQGVFNYEILENGTFNKNKFSIHLVEIPLEFRWRTSTADSYKFWRVYTGFKLGYVFATTSKYNSSLQNIKLKNIDNFNRIQYGLTLSFGYNTWNAYLYYALNPIFKNEVKIDGKSININAIKIGLIFYIL